MNECTGRRSGREELVIGNGAPGRRETTTREPSGLVPFITCACGIGLERWSVRMSGQGQARSGQRDGETKEFRSWYIYGGRDPLENDCV